MKTNNNVLKTSVLVIGQSGVGKSSLLNYIFSREVEKTGVGKAVTKKGIFPHDFKYDDDFIIKIYDTWGLEPEKDAAWKDLVFENISENDTKDISEWLNTIIICISASSDRIQEFEVNIIEDLLKDKRNIIVAITNCQSEQDISAEKIRKQLIEKTALENMDIVFVNSVSKKLIGRKEGTPTFGREKIVRAIIGNMWKTFRAKIPGYINSNMVRRETQWLTAEFKVIDSFKFPFIRKNTRIDEYVLNINNDLDAYIDSEVEMVNDEFRNAINYYSKLSKKFVEISLINSGYYKYGSDFNVDIREIFSEKVDATLEKLFSSRKKLIELANHEIRDGKTFRDILKTMGIELGMYLRNTVSLKKDLKESTRSTIREFNESMYVEIQNFGVYIDHLNIEKVFLDQIRNSV